MSDTNLIYKKIAAVMTDIGSIGKDRRNEGQKYNFRGIDDVYNAAHPLFVKHGIFSVPRVLKNERSERTTDKGSTLLYSIVEMEYTFYAEDGSSVVASAVGEGMDSGDKATNKAMSAAHKYAIIQLLSIPTQEAKDSEYDNHAVKPRTPQSEAVPSFPAPNRGTPLNLPGPMDAALQMANSGPGSYMITFGKHRGKTLEQIGAHDADGYGSWLVTNAEEKRQPLSGPALEAVNAIKAFVKSREFSRDKAGA